MNMSIRLIQWRASFLWLEWTRGPYRLFVRLWESLGPSGRHAVLVCMICLAVCVMYHFHVWRDGAAGKAYVGGSARLGCCCEHISRQTAYFISTEHASQGKKNHGYGYHEYGAWELGNWGLGRWIWGFGRWPIFLGRLIRAPKAWIPGHGRQITSETNGDMQCGVDTICRSWDRRRSRPSGAHAWPSHLLVSPW